MNRDLRELSPADLRDVENLLDLNGDSVLITGAGNGMGRVVSFKFAAAGADVAISDRLGEDLARTVSDLREAFDIEVVSVEADVSDPESITNLINSAVSQLGTIDVLINVAGVSTEESSETMSVDTWDLIQNVNLRGAFIAAREAFPHLRDGGRIINTSSLMGIFGASSMSHYAAAKNGVRILTRSLANEWADHNIRVNAVAPDKILTPGSVPYHGGTADAYDRTHIDRDVGSPDEIADVMLFLASPMSSYLTGETLSVAGVPPTFEDIYY